MAGIPSNQVEASVDVHPTGLPFGITVTIDGVGHMFDTVSGFGQVTSGNYGIVDLSGRTFLNKAKRQRLNVRLQNLFDKEYTTIHQRGFRDSAGPAFLVHNLGAPRTLYLSYSFSY